LISSGSRPDKKQTMLSATTSSFLRISPDASSGDSCHLRLLRKLTFKLLDVFIASCDAATVAGSRRTAIAIFDCKRLLTLMACAALMFS
jgi:hypothetical protein